jgi:hypothetical protein
MHQVVAGGHKLFRRQYPCLFEFRFLKFLFKKIEIKLLKIAFRTGVKNSPTPKAALFTEFTKSMAEQNRFLFSDSELVMMAQK